MNNCHELLDEIYKEKEIIKHCFYSSYKNIQDENEFTNFKGQYYKKLRLYIGIAIILYYVTSLVYKVMYERYFFHNIIIISVVLAFNAVSVVIIYKTQINSNVNLALCYIKFFLNVLTNINVLLHYMFTDKGYNEVVESNKLDVVRIIYLSYTMMFIEYCVYIRPSKLISNFLITLNLIVVSAPLIFYKENNIFIVPEMLTTAILYLLFQFSEVIWNFKREMFISIKQTDTLSN